MSPLQHHAPRIFPNLRLVQHSLGIEVVSESCLVLHSNFDSISHWTGNPFSSSLSGLFPTEQPCRQPYSDLIQIMSPRAIKHSTVLNLLIQVIGTFHDISLNNLAWHPVPRTNHSPRSISLSRLKEKVRAPSHFQSPATRCPLKKNALSTTHRLATVADYLKLNNTRDCIPREEKEKAGNSKWYPFQIFVFHPKKSESANRVDRHSWLFSRGEAAGSVVDA